MVGSAAFPLTVLLQHGDIRTAVSMPLFVKSTNVKNKVFRNADSDPINCSKAKFRFALLRDRVFSCDTDQRTELREEMKGGFL
ncbi:hypothetical protein EGR_08981 [Echinococcus granulosus]|uniref:Uncharacterized protein n=1 Tax=Echinococcus granulosus TaxID=6210 RepID=W6U725_ECHGR|nr:hypothetical protein EGR_08981 [Echinococcus granulosus]EUB56176.1 hypothetical protein EGR_08981 [Echinococcus granulosus]